MQMEDYFKTQGSLSASQDVRYVKKLFGCYDKKNKGMYKIALLIAKGVLEEKMALQFINDVLSVSGIKNDIQKNAPSGVNPGFGTQFSFSLQHRQVLSRDNKRAIL